MIKQKEGCCHALGGPKYCSHVCSNNNVDNWKYTGADMKQRINKMSDALKLARDNFND